MADRGLQSIHTCFEVVEALIELDGGGVSALAKHLDKPKTTVYEHIDTLHRMGYVVKKGTTYQASSKFLSLGEGIRNNYGIYRAAQPRIEALAKETNTVVNIMVEENGLGVIISVENVQDSLTKISDNGTATNLHISAPGKAILAQMPTERVKSIIQKRGLQATTDNTIVDSETLFTKLKTIREQGYAMDNEESVEGLQGLGVPIMDRNEGKVAGSIGLYGPARLKDAELFRDQYLDELSQVANTVEINLSYS